MLGIRPSMKAVEFTKSEYFYSYWLFSFYINILNLGCTQDEQIELCAKSYFER